MEKHSANYIEETILERCKAWFDMCVDPDNDWEDICNAPKGIFAYIKVFKEANDKYVLESHNDWWIIIDTILNDMEVALDGEEKECFYLWVECLNYMWSKLTVCMI